MQISEVNSAMIYDQLFALAYCGESDDCEAQEAEIYIDDHPLLATSRTIGSLAIKAYGDPSHGAQLEIVHKSRSSLSLNRLSTVSTSWMHIDQKGSVALLITSLTSSSSIGLYMSDVMYAQEVYLPAKIIDQFAVKKGSVAVRQHLKMSSMPELVDFIHDTAINIK